MYFPAEDSYFLSEQLRKLLKKEKKNIEILDMGSGSGIQSQTCIDFGFNRVLSADIEDKAIKHLKKQKLKAIKSDLFSNIKIKFDLIIFNPPYLPESKFDKAKDTSGGKKGDETILKFLEQSKYHLNNQGKILLLLSSSTPKKRINKAIVKLKLKKEKLAVKKIFFETLEIFLLKHQNSTRL